MGVRDPGRAAKIERQILAEAHELGQKRQAKLNVLFPETAATHCKAIINRIRLDDNIMVLSPCIKCFLGLILVNVLIIKYASVARAPRPGRKPYKVKALALNPHLRVNTVTTHYHWLLMSNKLYFCQF